MHTKEFGRRIFDSSLTFVREVLKAEPDPWQTDFLNASDSGKWQRYALKACKGPGKTAVIAMKCWHFLATRPNPKIAATSITKDNLDDNLWAEMSKWQARSELLKKLFVWTKTRIFLKECPENWFMSARTWPRAADPQQQADTLAGLHADYVMYVLDESGGIPDAVAAAAEGGLATGKECLILQAGNPTKLEGPLYRACTSERHLWYVQEITGDPDDPKRASRVSVQWARQQIEKYGRDNPWVLVNVFGKFPPASINALLGPDEVEAAMNRTCRKEDIEFAQKRLGIDTARFGDDPTIIFPRQGLQAFPYIEMRSARGHEIAARVALAHRNWQWETAFIDDTGGYGSSAVDSLIQAGFAPIAINFSSKADDSRYLNKRAEMFFRMSEWVKRGGCLPNSPELKRQLTTITYSFQNGKFRIEEKDQIKERLGRSCDEADGLSLTFAYEEQPTGSSQTASWHRGKLVSDFDPLREDRIDREPDREPLEIPRAFA